MIQSYTVYINLFQFECERAKFNAYVHVLLITLESVLGTNQY